MRAGKLRSLITIQHATDGTPDEYNHREPAWETFATAWADIIGLAGTQIERGPAVDAETSHRIEIRFREGITPRMRISHGGTLFNITAIVDPDRRRQRLFIFCSQRL